MNKIKLGLLPRVLVAIIAGVLLGYILPASIVRLFVTFNGLFANLLSFCIPLIILGLVVPSIADLGKSAGRLLVITVLIGYASTLFSGFFTYLTGLIVFPKIVNQDFTSAEISNDSTLLNPFFTIEMPPVFGVMTGLLLAFLLGIGIALGKNELLKAGFTEFKNIVERLIVSVILPLLPLHIFGIFLKMTHAGTFLQMIEVFGKVIAVIFVLHILLLIIQFCIAGAIAKRNPFSLLNKMLPAYVTALGTSSSAATIPVTLAQAKKCGVNEAVANFCVPLCATIHLAGSIMKIVALALAICMTEGMPFSPEIFVGFIAMLGVLMVAAPGVPGGAIMAATGVLQSMLNFNPENIGLIIALHLAIDSFGTACNVTGDGAIAVIVNKIARVSR